MYEIWSEEYKLSQQRLITNGVTLNELGFKMFQTFARMEYALKAAGYHQGDGDAKANWDRLGQECDDALNSSAKPEVQQAIQYILNNPPRKQIIENGQLVWKDVRAGGQTIGEQLLVYVRRVRNNLFHGGKFNGNWFAPQRSEELLQHSLVILFACMEARNDVGTAFDDK